LALVRMAQRRACKMIASSPWETRAHWCELKSGC
jgi:hypothetical protein